MTWYVSLQDNKTQKDGVISDMQKLYNYVKDPDTQRKRKRGEGHSGAGSGIWSRNCNMRGHFADWLRKHGTEIILSFINFYNKI